MVNNNYMEYRERDVRLRVDINLSGSTYATFTGDPALNSTASTVQWKPVRDAIIRLYEETFDGRGHEVDGMYINEGTCSGLFGIIEYPMGIRNLEIGASSKITGSGENYTIVAGGA